MIYAKPGLGKTSLAFLAPSPVFISLDDGSRRLGANSIPGIESYQDVRDAIQQVPSLIPKGGTLVLDELTRLEQLAGPHIFATIKAPSGKTASSLEEYSYGKGWSHLKEHMIYVLADLDNVIRAGINVILLAQEGAARIPNQDGVDFLEAGPALYNTANANVRMAVIAWADHVLRINYADMTILKENVNARAGKISGDRTRAIYADGPLSFVAKSRPIGGKRLPAAISFGNESDDSLWSMIFRGAIPDAST